MDLAALALNPTVAVLDNGLMVIVQEDDSAPLLSTALLYRVGAAEDTLDGGRTGKAHLFEHMMFEGSLSIPQPGSEAGLDELLGQAGVTTNGWTSHDWTVYTNQGHPGALDAILFAESDRMGWLLEAMGDDDLANQREIVLNERRGDELSDYDHPQYTLGWLLQPEGHPYRWPVLGTAEDIAQVERAELERFFRSWYGPNNAILVVVGDVEAEAVVASAERWFSGIEAIAPPARAEDIPHELLGSERWVMVDDRALPMLWLAWPTVPHGHADEAALDVLSSILTGGRGTRLDDRLLYDRARVTAVNAWTSNARLNGEFVIALEQPDGPLAPTLRRVDRELQRIVRHGVTQAEVDRAVGGWLGPEIASFQDAETRATMLALCSAMHGEPDCWRGEIEALAAVTPEDVRRVAETWLGEDRIVLSVVAPTDQDYALEGSARVYAP